MIASDTFVNKVAGGRVKTDDEYSFHDFFEGRFLTLYGVFEFPLQKGRNSEKVGQKHEFARRDLGPP